MLKDFKTSAMGTQQLSMICFVPLGDFFYAVLQARTPYLSLFDKASMVLWSQIQLSLELSNQIFK